MPQLAREPGGGHLDGEAPRAQVGRGGGSGRDRRARWRSRPPSGALELVEAERAGRGAARSPRRGRCRPRARGGRVRRAGCRRRCGPRRSPGPGGGPGRSGSAPMAASSRARAVGVGGRASGLAGVEPPVVDAPPVGGHGVVRLASHPQEDGALPGPLPDRACTNAVSAAASDRRAASLVHPRRGHDRGGKLGGGRHHDVRVRPAPPAPAPAQPAGRCGAGSGCRRPRGCPPGSAWRSVPTARPATGGLGWCGPDVGGSEV